jgi:8-oxo-dGTP diphosphatase
MKSATPVVSPSAEVPRFVTSVDTVIFGYSQKSIWIPLTMRAREPFVDFWSLPGGVVQEKENLEQACHRVLEKNIGMKIEHLEQLYTFADPKRDIRGRTISVAYWALVANEDRPLTWGPGVKAAKWFKLGEIPLGKLAFDHAEIVIKAVERLRAKVAYEPVGLKLLPAEFSLSELQFLYEAILGRPVERRNFYPKILRTGLLDFKREQKSLRGKPMKLYRFNHARYAQLREKGFYFEAI